MNKAKLKAYAPAARRDFIQAVTQRANLLGLTASDIAPVQSTGDIVLINGRPWPAKVAKQREFLVARIKLQGFAAVMEVEAYGWFNRFAALRFMELHGYLDHGYRVLSSQVGVLPDILENAASLDSNSLPGLDRDEVVRLKIAGDKDNELYRLLLTTQCNALATSMGFLFETLDDETELLLPDNLLNTDSVIAKMVASIDEADWEQVEIIGWLYQFYISEKKDEVIGKVVKSEDIPAATQLFTPNWIVKFLTQNSIGRLWLMANPSSNLASQMAYYVAPAIQTPGVDEALNALFQTRMAEDGGSLNPETITVLDPACGSGHILVEAYDILKAIYLERGYQPRAIPRLILEKNLFGLDIDDRAAQLAGFALLMKARADDRRMFDEKIVLNVTALQDSHGVDDETLANVVFGAAIELEGGDAVHSGQLFGGDQLATQHSSGLKVADFRELIKFFASAKTFGSLLTVPTSIANEFDKFDTLLRAVMGKGNPLAQSYAKQIYEQFFLPGKILTKHYDAVIANPPYMGGKGMNTQVKDFAKKQFPESKSDLFAMFIERGFELCKKSGLNSMVTMQSWMFLSSFEPMREKLLAERTIVTMAHLGARAFSEISGEVVQTTAFVFQRSHQLGFKPVFFRLAEGNETEKEIVLRSGLNRHDQTAQDDFKKIPGSPIAYWIPKSLLEVYSKIPQLYESSISDGQNITANNDQFVRFLWEINKEKLGKEKKWVYYAKGGQFKKWYGNNDIIVDWTQEARNFYRGNSSARIIPEYLWFEPGITWTLITSTTNSFRLLHEGGTFDKTGSSIFMREKCDINSTLAFLNSCVANYLLKIFSSTVALQVDEVRRLPFSPISWRESKVVQSTEELCKIAKLDWDSDEISGDFSGLGIFSKKLSDSKISESWQQWEILCQNFFERCKALEEENNRIFIDAYGLQNELSSEVLESQITIRRAERSKDIQRLISYAIGCMMGRYSLNEPGLIYAQAGNFGFDSTRYQKFPADADGIIPVTDDYWFDDDAANRIREFLHTVWGMETLDENMNWLAEGIGRKTGQSADEVIRNYLAGNFFKDHLKTYKKRPIYWLFSSGKQKAFECLVYLHRYNEGTLARMRNEYVIPLTGKFGGRADLLQNKIDCASTTSERTKLQKELDSLKKKQLELAQFDEQLRHFADQRISIDLDDGVKVNYGKFGNLLAEVKSITGGKDDE